MAASNPEAVAILAEIGRVSPRAKHSQEKADVIFQERNTLFVKAYEMKVPMAQIARAAGISDSAVRCVVVGRGK
jgi:hypothetical protein